MNHAMNMESDLYSVVATFEPKPGKYLDLASRLSDLIRMVLVTEPEALIYYAFRVEDSDNIIVVGRFKSKAGFETHVNGRAYKTLADRLPDLTAKPVDMKVGTPYPGCTEVSRTCISGS